MFQISLRHLLVLVTISAIAVVSVRYASATWEVIAVSLATIVFFGAVIVALVGRGPGQAFAIGLAVVMAGYAFFKLQEKPPTTADYGMFTSYLLVQLVWKTGNVLPLKYVFPIGHAWFPLLFGYVAGLFARFVYMRRAKESSAPTST